MVDTQADTDYRIEHDTMGEVRVPAAALYGAQTQRAVENFPISGSVLESSQIAALARIKKSAALANAKLGVLDQSIADAIAAAADEVVTGAHDDEFPIDVYQTGSRHLLEHEHERGARHSRLAPARPARSPERPRERLAVVERRLPHLGARRRHRRPDRRPHPGARPPRGGARGEGRAVVRPPSRPAAPTSWTPLRSPSARSSAGTPRQIRLGIERVQSALHRVAEVPLGGTAVGTGINTPLGFPQLVIELLTQETELPITEARNHFEAQAQPGCAGRDLRRPPHHRRQPHQDLQRPALDGLRPQHRTRRAAHPRPAARLLDHARQGQPGHPGGGADGRARA